MGDEFGVLFPSLAMQLKIAIPIQFLVRNYAYLNHTENSLFPQVWRAAQGRIFLKMCSHGPPGPNCDHHRRFVGWA